MPYRLKDDETLGEGLVRVAREQADRALESLEGEGELGPRVHDARKRFKKIRAVLRLLRSTLGTSAFERENDCYRSLGHLLGPYREGAVRVESVQALFREEGGRIAPETWVAVHDRLEQARPQVREEPGSDSPLETAARTLREARARMEEWPRPENDFDAVADDLERIYRKGRKRLARAEKENTAEAHHDWRKRVKDLRYHQRILRPVWPGVLEAERDEAKRLTDLLGTAHDMADLGHFLTHADPPPVKHEEFARLLDLIDARRLTLEAEARRLGARIYALKPKAHIRRMRTCYETWRGEIARPVMD
jgi:CHAD domain-containing protein